MALEGHSHLGVRGSVWVNVSPRHPNEILNMGCLTVQQISLLTSRLTWKRKPDTASLPPVTQRPVDTSQPHVRSPLGNRAQVSSSSDSFLSVALLLFLSLLGTFWRRNEVDRLCNWIPGRPG